jgi:hypothetical protein
MYDLLLTISYQLKKNYSLCNFLYMQNSHSTYATQCLKGAWACPISGPAAAGSQNGRISRPCATAGNFGFRGSIGLIGLKCQVKYALTPQVSFFLVFSS